MGYSLAAVNQWNLTALALYFDSFFFNNGILYTYYVDLCRSMQNICNIGSLTGVFSVEYVSTVDGQQLYHYIYNRNSSHDEILPRNDFPPNGSRRDLLLQSESSETANFFCAQKFSSAKHRQILKLSSLSHRKESIQAQRRSRKRPFWDHSHRPGEVQWDMCETWVNWSGYICIGVIKRGNGKSMSTNENHKFR